MPSLPSSEGAEKENIFLILQNYQHMYSSFFLEISTVDLYFVVTVKSTMEIFQSFVAFSEYTAFTFFPFPRLYDCTV